ncbi:MAG: SDR family NAD(P)-dependent oxidoreductase [Candidatus Poseidoniales archaeon]|nr:MAG: SDR family NAD(P)-dependent oxidoreductase [Candidatus Poseidoniales archaeon]
MSLDESPQDPFEPIAIIGVGAILPDAPDAETFWQNVIDTHVSIREVPGHRWVVADHWVEGGPKNIPEGKTYSKIGGFVEGFEFDWRRWRVPPGSLTQIDLSQQWAVSVSAAALEDAGYLGENPRSEIPKARTGVIFANALGGENRNLSNHRVWADSFARKAVEAGMPPESVDSFKEAISEGTPHVDEDTMPGELANVVAGRVANLLDLQGPNYATDAACASTFAAILDASRLLQARQVDLMVAGASDRTMDPATFSKFSAIGALSASHSTPFDAGANGFVMGEGAGAFILKRLDDAISDGDRIYAVIRGLGGSSDGRGKGITAPSTRGQVQALARTYQQAGYGPETVEMIEAHGTSTIVGDATELNSLTELYGGDAKAGSVGVGSIKSQIGHLKAAAGAAGLLKATFALHHRTLPPSAGFVNPNTSLDWSSIPFFVPTEARDWPSPKSHPRRASISAFGFGGTNFHCALEQFDPEFHANLAAEWRMRRDAYLMKPSAGFSDSVLASVMKRYGIKNRDEFLSHASAFDNDGNDYLNRKELTAAAEAFGEESASMTWEEIQAIEGGLLLLSASDIEAMATLLIEVRSNIFDGSPTFDDSPEGRRLSAILPQISEGYVAEGVRVGLVADSWATLEKRFTMLESSLDDRSKWDFLAKQFIFVSDSPPLTDNQLLAHMYPGQGSQYVGMTHDLSMRYGIIGSTWKEADLVMEEIIGEPLSDFVLRTGLSKQEIAAAEEKLKQTEYTQPAMLTADLALERLLNQHGIRPDMVAGHSLGEYAALMVSGILRFEDALRAAAARGTEMGSVDVPDRGIMASITAPFDAIESVLSSLDGYVIAANKNSPTMTVIAGETEPMREAMRLFEEGGATVVQLQTSHAFHSRIVAPANEPLRRFLEDLEISLPSIPVSANVDGTFYPNVVQPGQDAKDAILEKLAPQMSSAVEWTSQVRSMHEAGARIYLEVGPKRALALFASQIIDDDDCLVNITNHPKAGGITSFLGALAMLAVAGRIPEIHGLESSIHTPEFQAGPKGTNGPQVGTLSSAEAEALRLRARPLPQSSVTSVSPTTFEPSTSSAVTSTGLMEDEFQAQRRVAASIGKIIAKHVSYPEGVLVGQVSFDEIGLTPQAIAMIADEARQIHEVSDVDPATFSTIQELVDWVVVQPIIRPVDGGVITSSGSEDPQRGNPVVSGVSLGLPGLDEVFDEGGWDAILRGHNLISELSPEMKQRLLDKRIVRLVKEEDGTANLVPADTLDTIPQLAGQGGHFDLAEQYGIDPHLVDAFDIATSLAFAAGLEALADAGLPLMPVEQVNGVGKRMIRRWSLPEAERDRTGVIFASVFPGLQKVIEHALNNGQVEGGHFDRKYLLQVLSMGHSQFANWIGARGPNLAINNACASTPAAFAIAEDWMATGRCDRVIIVSGDDSTSDILMPWIGAGFAAAGAHAMGSEVSEVALPFDARRHGMLLGMGGAAFVIERPDDSLERGVTPYVEVLGAEIANSAYHPTRLDTEHAAMVMERFVARMEVRHGLNRADLVDDMTFMSHEPYTPPRGGSASAEVASLRSVFGEGASRILITNGKGYTGHPMGVGLEDAIVIRGLAAGRLPPIANFRDVDSTLGELNLCMGGQHDVRYALRHGAGFGSQIALTFLRRIANSDTARFTPGRIDSWVKAHSGASNIHLRILDRKFVAYLDPDDNLIGGVQGDNPLFEASESSISDVLLPVPATSHPVETTSNPVPDPVVPAEVSTPPESTLPSTTPPSNMDIQSGVLSVVAEATGYPSEFLELDADMEGELGIDSIKQAEIMAELRGMFSIPVDDSFQLREHPTLGHVIGYIASFDSVSSTELEPTLADSDDLDDEEEITSSEESISVANDSEEKAVTTPVSVSTDAVDEEVIQVVVEHTGYPAEFLEMDADMEGELGIDSIKQAEIMADLRSKFGLSVDESFQLRDHPTLGHVIQYIRSEIEGGDVTPALVSPLETEEVAVIETPSTVEEDEMALDEIEDTTSEPEPKKGPVESRRFQVEVEPCSWGDSVPIDLAGRSLVVTDDAWGIAGTLCSLLEDRGIEAVRVFFDASVSSGPIRERDGEVDILRADPSNADQMLEVARIVREIAPPAGIVHLAPVRLAGVPWEDVTTNAHLDQSISGLFSILKGLDEDLRDVENGLVASVSALDGRHGIGGDRFNAIAAGAHGGIKSYGRERPHLRSRAVDLDPGLLEEPDTLAEMLLSELLEQSGPREVAVERDGTRYRLSLYEEALETESTPLLDDDVWVVSGGGAGVTARSIIEVARRSQGVGARFVLLGRSSLDLDQERFLDLGDEELEAERMSLREKMIEESDDGSVSLKQWNDSWNRWLRGLEIHSTLKAIGATGNRANYVSVDVTDRESTCSALHSVSEEWGPVTGIVHGAGIEDSTPFERKDPEIFQRVLQVKIQGWRNLASALENDLPNMRFLSVFTSIAGRQGNAMQFGYCAANQVLDVEMARIAAHGEAPRAIAIAWAPWADVGMATRGSLESVFDHAGIDMISADDGASRFADEALCSGKRMVMIAGRLGQLDDEDSIRPPPQRLPQNVANLLADPMRFPLIGHIEELVPYTSVVFSTVIDSERHPHLKDHAIDGVPYMPGVMALEAFAESAVLLWPLCAVDGFDDVEFGLPVKVTKDRKSIRVKAEFDRQDDDHIWIRCHLETDLTNSSGEIFGEPTIHHRGVVRLLKSGGSAEQVGNHNLGQVTMSSAIHGPSFVYERMFHGPRFQVHGGVIGGVDVDGDRGLDGHILRRDELPNQELFAGESRVHRMHLEFLPMVVEGCLQNAGLVSMEVDGLESLPVGIGHLDMDVTSFSGSLRVRTVRRSIDDQGMTIHDAVVVNEDNAVVMHILGLRLKGMAPILEGERFTFSDA